MSAALTQFLIDITRGHRAADFVRDREAVIASSNLEEAIRTALREQDVAYLWIAGAHPIALLYFARACGWDQGRYYSCISATARAR
jgi:Aromatic-ring-opening dioxygenase LigAB, LigA subunit